MALVGWRGIPSPAITWPRWLSRFAPVPSVRVIPNSGQGAGSPHRKTFRVRRTTASRNATQISQCWNNSAPQAEAPAVVNDGVFTGEGPLGPSAT